MGELIGAHKQAFNHEGWVVQGEMVCANGPVEQLQREDSLFLLPLYTQVDMVSRSLTIPVKFLVYEKSTNTLLEEREHTIQEPFAEGVSLCNPLRLMGNHQGDF